MGEGRFALGVLLGFAIALTTYLLLSAFDQELTRGEAIEFVPALVALMVAVISLLISFQALSEQRKMRQAGTDPVLIAHLSGRKDAPVLIMLRFSNVGAGAATNVRVSIAEQDWPELLERTKLKRESFSTPFSVILQGEMIEYMMHVAHELLGDTPLAPFSVILEYEDVDGGKYKSEHRIDLRELSGQGVTSPAETKVVQALEGIQRNIGRLASGQKRLGVVTEARADFLERESEEHERLLKQFKDAKDKEKD